MPASIRRAKALLTSRWSCAQYMLTMWWHVLTPLQLARIFVAAYPQHVDVVALVKCGTSQCTGPTNVLLLRSGLAHIV